MSFRRFATGAALAIAGLMAAAGIGLLANSISGDNVGLGAEPLSAGETLAVHDKADDGAQKRKQRERRRRRNRGGDETRTTSSPTLTDELSPAAPTDDNGEGSGHEGGGDSGSGGSGSSDSGSGHGGSGSGGSDDSGGGGDDD